LKVFSVFGNQDKKLESLHEYCQEDALDTSTNK